MLFIRGLFFTLKHLSDLCGISAQLAKSTADILYHYFTSFTPQRRVVKEMGMKSVIKCFKLPSKIGNVLIRSTASSSGCHDDGTCTIERNISEAEGEEGHTPSRSCPVTVVELSLKEGLSNLTLLDLGRKRIIITFSSFASVWCMDFILDFKWFSSWQLL